MIDFEWDEAYYKAQTACCRCRSDVNHPNAVYFKGPSLVTGKIAKICYNCYDEDLDLQEWADRENILRC